MSSTSSRWLDDPGTLALSLKADRSSVHVKDDLYTTDQVYRKDEVYSRAQSDGRYITTLPSWGRLLVGALRIRFTSTTSFIDMGGGFNLVGNYINNTTVLITLTDHRPDSTGYVVRINGDNVPFDYRFSNGTGEFAYASDSSIASFQMRLFGNRTLLKGFVFSIDVYHDNMTSIF